MTTRKTWKKYPGLLSSQSQPFTSGLAADATGSKPATFDHFVMINDITNIAEASREGGLLMEVGFRTLTDSVFSSQRAGCFLQSAKPIQRVLDPGPGSKSRRSAHVVSARRLFRPNFILATLHG